MASPYKPRLALLVTDTPLPAIVDTLGAYPNIFKTWLLASAFANVDVVLDEYDTLAGQLPSDPDAYDGMIITGSKHSAYDDTPWIKQLIEFIARVARDHTRVKIIGICFGHQIIAQALGGPTATVSNPAGWEPGVYTVALTSMGKRIFGAESIDIQQMHRDHVPAVPQGTIGLGSSQKCPVQGLVKLYHNVPEGEEIDLSKDVQIFSVQGHPEFTGFIVETVVRARGATGAMDPSTVQDGLERAHRPHDGHTLIGHAVWKVLGLH
ncbi:class I glutamine amidotransferase-like protein [Auriculariales sp. MPI-PUGE-AT-0066]|nr:class I glutamine amidotransferase-like protein [Auriculariales sp. MPI-PUGE-AT-0066]